MRLKSDWEKILNDAVDKRIKEVISGSSIKDDALPIGFNPIEKIRGALFHWIAVPFCKVDIWCQLRCPNETQLEQCGDISNITIGQDESKFTYEDAIKIRNYQEELCKLVFNNPTFNHIAKLVGDNDFVISEKKEELAGLVKTYDDNKKNMTEIEKKTLDMKIRTIELQIGYILPDDTMAFVTRWAMGNDISDVKKLSRESLLRAASLAKIHHKAPTDYLSGVFTDFNKVEIDAHASYILEEFLKDQQVTKESGKRYNWFLGGRKREGGIMLPKKPGGKD